MSFPRSKIKLASRNKKSFLNTTTHLTTSLQSLSILVFLTLGPVKKLPQFPPVPNHIVSNNYIFPSFVCSYLGWVAPLHGNLLETGKNCCCPVVVVHHKVNYGSRITINAAMNEHPQVEQFHVGVNVTQIIRMRYTVRAALNSLPRSVCPVDRVDTYNRLFNPPSLYINAMLAWTCNHICLTCSRESI